MRFFKSIAILFVTCALVACGGGGDSGSSGSAPAMTVITPTDTSISSDNGGLVSISGKASPDTKVIVTFPDGSTQEASVNSSGNYSLMSNTPQNSGSIKIQNADDQGNTSTTVSESFVANLESIAVLKALYKATGIMPELPFKPSLGINTEAPQGGVDTAGMPMPFVDIFRTARPFKEFEFRKDQDGNIIANITGDITVDEFGWPTKLNTNTNTGQPYTKTVLLQGALKNSIPNGKYSLLYTGDAKFEFSTSSGSLKSFKKVNNENKYELDLSLEEIHPQTAQESERDYEARTASTNQFGFNLKSVDSGTNLNIKDIRIIMPGGTCKANSTGLHNPYLRVESQADCPSGSTYESFESRLKTDRNTIIFNPDYLLFLRNFKVVRMMNLMESSLKKLCFKPSDCPAELGTWNHRAKLDDAVWGGNDGRTPHEDHKGVPIEVMVDLANTLQRDIWVNMPHIADNDYVKNYAKYVYENLDPTRQVYVEYSNEVWNNGFAANNYATAKGIELGLDSVPEAFQGSNRDADYFARLRYYSQRAEEMFILWKSQFGGAGDTRIQRVLGSFIGDKILTEQMLKNINTSNVDAVAIAPYFFGCPYTDICIDAPKTLATATTVDDIFDIMDQGRSVDVKSLDGTIAAVENQLSITNAYNTKLLTYEGGQHLVTGVFGTNINDSDKPRLRKLFNDANRDPRMKDRYMRFLNTWKDLSDQGTTLFTLYTMPQSFYRFGNFGIKEHLNMSRQDSPKFDGAMTFQEMHKDCWWAGCNP